MEIEEFQKKILCSQFMHIFFLYWCLSLIQLAFISSFETFIIRTDFEYGEQQTKYKDEYPYKEDYTTVYLMNLSRVKMAVDTLTFAVVQAYTSYVFLLPVNHKCSE